MRRKSHDLFTPLNFKNMFGFVFMDAQCELLDHLCWIAIKIMVQVFSQTDETCGWITLSKRAKKIELWALSPWSVPLEITGHFDVYSAF